MIFPLTAAKDESIENFDETRATSSSTQSYGRAELEVGIAIHEQANRLDEVIERWTKNPKTENGFLNESKGTCTHGATHINRRCARHLIND